MRLLPTPWSWAAGTAHSVDSLKSCQKQLQRGEKKYLQKARVETSTHLFGKISGWEADKPYAFGLSSTHLSKAGGGWELIEINFISLFAGDSNEETRVHLL